MIQLRSDCLVFKTLAGHSIPCSAQFVTVALVGLDASQVDSDLLQHATAAVVHYFKEELGRCSVSLAEFSEALELVLRHFGLSIRSPVVTVDPSGSVIVSDLRQLASDSGKGFELAFFPRLRGELQKNLTSSPRVLRFHGLRGCVKQLAGAQRWSARCQELSDQIVDFLRSCWKNEARGTESALVVH
jgi:hypothetical protein